MLSLHAETPEEKRDLALTLAAAAPAVLEDLKRLGVLFGPFERIELEIKEEARDGHPV